MFWKRLAVLIVATCAYAAEDAYWEGVQKINAGDYAGAHEILLAEWQRCKQQLGEHAANTLRVQVHLGQALTMMGRPREGLDLLAPAARELEVLSGTGSRDNSIANATLAIALRETGNYTAAQKLLVPLLDNLSLPVLDRANINAQYALTMGYLKKHKEGLRAARTAVAISESGGLRDTPHHVHLLVTLGQLQLVAGKVVDGGETFRYAEKAAGGLLADNHPERATLYSGLGVVCLTEGKRREGEQYLRRALNLAEGVLGPDHQEVAVILQYLAAALDRGHKKEANALQTRSADIFRRASQDPVSVWSLKAKD